MTYMKIFIPVYQLVVDNFRSRTRWNFAVEIIGELWYDSVGRKSERQKEGMVL